MDSYLNKILIFIVMGKNNFVLVNLNDGKTKKLAEVITSETSRMILNHLTEKEDTEANMAKVLNIPISTIHYHLQKLQEAKLVVVDEFHYSKKGREVNHYKLANKYIIIAPKKTSGLKQALKSVLPVGLVVLGISALIKIMSGTFGSMKSAAVPVMQKATTFGAEAMDQAVTAGAEGLAETAAPGAADVITQTTVSEPNIALWFLLGGFTALGLYLVIGLIREFLKKK